MGKNKSGGGKHSHRSTVKVTKKGQQKRQNKKQEEKKRGENVVQNPSKKELRKKQQQIDDAEQNSKLTAPKLVVFVGFSDNANPCDMKRKCLKALITNADAVASNRKNATNESDNIVSNISVGGQAFTIPGDLKNINLDVELAKIEPYKPCTVLLPSWAQPSHSNSGNARAKQRLTLLDVPSRDKFQVLDACKAADIVVCCFGPECSLEKPCFDDLGYDTLTCLKSQGMGTVVGAIQGLHFSDNLSNHAKGQVSYDLNAESNYYGLLEEFDFKLSGKFSI